MKEVTYGWYPSAKDIYRPKGKPSSHHLQCLYKFHGYQGQPVVRQAELFVRGVSSPASPDLSQHLKRKSKSAPIPKLRTESRIHIPTPTKCWSRTQETQWGIADDQSPKTPNPPSEISWPILQDGTQQQQQQYHHHQQQQQKQLNVAKNIQEQQEQLLKEYIQKPKERYILEGHQNPQNAWGFRNPSQNSSDSSSEASSRLTWPSAHRAHPVRPQSSYSAQSVGHHQGILVGHKLRPSSSPAKSSVSSAEGGRGWRSPLTPSPPSRERGSSTKLLCRTHSATVRHEKAPPPIRPVTSFSNRRSVHEQEPISRKSAHYEREESPPATPAAPVPLPNNSAATAGLPAPTVLSRSPSCQSEDGVDDSYEAVVERYGWRAQVHGDPYQLKKPMKRESYTVKCKAPDLLPDPPSIHMETKEPFFYNTIPKRPLSFSVDREWMSEVLLAKRLELQERDHGIRYNYKKFAFVY